MDLTVGIFHILAAAAEGESSDVFLSFEAELFIWTLLAFGLMLFLLTKFAWKPIAQQLNDRADKIEGEIARARKMREDADDRYAEYSKKLDAVREEIDELWAKNRAEAEVMKAQVEAKAREEADSIIANARKETELMAAQLKSELQSIVVEMSLEVAGKVLDRAITDDDQRRFAEDAVAAGEAFRSAGG
jgi:F-type H+-transporting ATPase subunit b